MGYHLVEGGHGELHHRTLGVQPEKQIQEGGRGLGTSVSVDKEVNDAVETEVKHTLGDGVGGTHEAALSEYLEDGAEDGLRAGEAGLALGPAEEAEGEARAASD